MAWVYAFGRGVVCPCETSTVAVDFHDIEAPGLLTWLQGWYASACDGDWEHENGVSIDTLDNPGWRLRIQVTGTGLETKPFDRVKVERDEHDWVHAWLEEGCFQSACGPTNLSEAIYLFRQWVTA